MTESVSRWAPRIAGIVVTVFVASFSLDAVNDGVGALAIHLLPALALGLVVALAWRREWIGGLVFLALALFYAAVARARPDWVVVIAIPLGVVGALYLVSWRAQHRTVAGSGRN